MTFPDRPPSTRRDLFERIRGVISHGWYDLPQGAGFGGTGGPGMFLEALLGLTAGSVDMPDAVGWELKWYTKKTHLVTLFHKEPDGPPAIMRYMVRHYGKIDDQGRRSFRHTIRGSSDRFRIHDDAGQLIVRPLHGNGPVPYWTHEELVGAVGSKLRRLIMVQGERRKGGQQVRFLRADAYETFHLADFIYEVLQGRIAIDFDARESKPNSDGLRNHGTKFRVPPDMICRLYMRKWRLVG